MAFSLKPFEGDLEDDVLEDDDVFVQNQYRENSPEFYEVSYSNPLSSARNSLSSISELANDEEVARFMAHDRRSQPATAMQDPRFDLFCRWLESQDNANSIGKPSKVSQSDLSGSGDEFHDAEKEQSPPECVKEMMAATITERSKDIPVIPTITVPVTLTKNGEEEEEEDKSGIEQQEPEPIANKASSLISLNDPAKLMRRRLHSPKKGRAPEPPKSPMTIPKSEDNLHLETII